MGIRQRNYWLKQADAIRRQVIADIAHGVGIGMADKNDRQQALDELELTQTAEESKKQLAESAWGLAKTLKGGKGV